MSYEMLVEQVKTLPEVCLDEASHYLEERGMARVESDETFNAKLERGYADMKAGRTSPLEDAFSEIRAGVAQ